MEHGDWKNSVYQIYEEVTGQKLKLAQEDLGVFGAVEQNVLKDVCEKNGVPQVLVSRLLQSELESQGMVRHSKIYSKLNKIISEEWRENLAEIVKDLHKKREDKQLYQK